MRKQIPFLDVIVRKFAGAARRSYPRPSEPLHHSNSTRGDAVAAPPASFALPAASWPQEHCATEPLPLYCFSEERSLWTLAARLSLLLLLLTPGFASHAEGVREVGVIGLTVGDLDRELMFYTNTLPFELVSISEASGKEQDALLGLSDVKLRVAMLKLGDERISLTEHLRSKGKPIPPDSRSLDHWFQHIAIVVRDMDEAYERLRLHKVEHVSTAPQTLPAWNKGAAGIKAFYFHDPEDHVLEIISFPPGKGDPKWQHSGGAQETGRPLFLGIDHTAIVVSDTDTSLAFYRDSLGFRVAGESENYGLEQEHLNQVFGARLHITGLRADRGPGVEFLEYIAPPGGRGLPADAQANDLIFWTTQLVVDDLTKPSHAQRLEGAKFVSLPHDASSAKIVRDPDGHALIIQRSSHPATSTADK